MSMAEVDVWFNPRMSPGINRTNFLDALREALRVAGIEKVNLRHHQTGSFDTQCHAIEVSVTVVRNHVYQDGPAVLAHRIWSQVPKELAKHAGFVLKLPAGHYLNSDSQHPADS